MPREFSDPPPPYQPLCRQLAELLASFPDGARFSAAQRARWAAPLKPWMLARPDSAGVRGEVLYLLAADGGDDWPVGDCSVSAVQKWLNPFSGNLSPNHRTLIRFVAWCRLDLCRMLALVLKRDWESWIKPRYGWSAQQGFIAEPHPDADTATATTVHGLALSDALAHLAARDDPTERAAFRRDLPGLLEEPTLADYARRLAHEIDGAGHPIGVSAERVAAVVERLLDADILHAEGLDQACGRELDVRRAEVLHGVREVLTHHARYQAAIERYRFFLEDQAGHLDTIVAAKRRATLVERLLGALRALCKSAAGPVDAAALRRIGRRLRQEQRDEELSGARPVSDGGGAIAQILGQPRLRVPIVRYREDLRLRQRLLGMLHPDIVFRLPDLTPAERERLWAQLNELFATGKALIDAGDVAGVLMKARELDIDLTRLLAGEREIASALAALDGLCDPQLWEEKIAEVERHYEAQTIPIGGDAGVSVASLLRAADHLASDWRGRRRPELELADAQCEAGLTPEAKELLRLLCEALDAPDIERFDTLCTTAGKPETH
ncbi:hypothetical protein [Thioflavicoccus mobilis]|uniref:hypothetical protein n=1 Tax=Thioflavicoccus mobilis TaxID=80679 RepID=UPI000317D6E6|nr:hypothetical protein [Thioflavicoccus mobilis]